MRLNNHIKLFIVLYLSYAAQVGVSQNGPIAPTANIMMQYYFENHDLVAIGHFTKIVDSQFQIPPLIKRDVQAIFVIEKVYKIPEVDTEKEITFTLNSDMLVFPGENISRYGKRREILDELSIHLEELTNQRKQIEEQLQNNEIDESEYNKLMDSWDENYESMISQSSSVSKGTVGIIGSESFYDLGGYITPDQKYLIFSNKIGNYYSLDPIGSSSYIYWGERMNLFSDILESDVISNITN